MNHQQQKDAARTEALDHYRANVADPRNGMNQDLHKARDMAAIDHTDDFRGKGMSRKPEADLSQKNAYKVKTGESC